MSKSIKFKNDKFIDATGVVYKQKPLNENLDCLNKVVNYFYIAGLLNSANLWWRVLELPSQFCGFIFLLTDNFSGIMQNNIIKITNSYGVVELETLSNTTFASKKFSTLRLIHKPKTSSTYLEIQANGTLRQIAIHIGIVGMTTNGSFYKHNEVGKIDSGYNVTSVNL